MALGATCWHCMAWAASWTWRREEEKEEEGWSGAGGIGRCLPDMCLSVLRSGMRSRNGIWNNKGMKHRNGLFIGQEFASGQSVFHEMFVSQIPMDLRQNNWVI